MKIINLTIAILFFSSCMKGKKVDQIFHNASILCLDDANTTAEAIAIKDGKIVEIGPERQILNKYRAEEIIDIEGKELVPTFSDSYLLLDSTVNENSLKEIEIQQLEQGITEVFVHNITNNQLLTLLKFSTKMELIWHINLSSSQKNFSFIRKYHQKITTNFRIQGFTISNNDIQSISEACAIAKRKHLQIGIDFKKTKQNISIVINSLTDYNKDHRWYVYNTDDKAPKILKILEETNFFFILNETNHFNSPLYVFGSVNPKKNLYKELSNYSKINNLDFVKSLKSISNWAHYLSFSEANYGSLEKGKYANFTILETPLSTSSNYDNIYSNTTFIKGKKIYSME